MSPSTSGRRRHGTGKRQTIIAVVVFALVAATVTPTLTQSASAAVTAQTFATGSYPASVAVDTNNHDVYTANQNSSNVTIFNGVTGATSTFPTLNAMEVAVDSSTHTAFVSRASSTAITVAVNGTVSRTVTVGGTPLSLAVDGTNRLLYSVSSTNVSVVNTSTWVASTFTLPGGAVPTAVALDPTAGRVYIPSASPSNVLFILEQSDNSVIATVPLAGTPSALTVNPVTHRAYLPFAGTNQGIAVIANNTVLTTIPGNYPANIDGIAVDSTTNTIYVTGLRNANLWIFSGATNSLTTSMLSSTGNFYGVAVDSILNTVYGTNGVANTTTMYRPPTAVLGNPPAGTINTPYATTVSASTGNPAGASFAVASGALPVGLSLNPLSGVISGTATAVGSNTFTITANNGIVAITPAAKTFTITIAAPATVAVGAAPYGIAVDETTHTVYVTNRDGNTVSVMNGTTGVVTNTIPVGTSPKGIAIDPSTGTVYVANWGSGTVSVINNKVVTATISGLTAAGDIAVDSVTHTVYVTSYNQMKLYTIDTVNGNAVTVNSQDFAMGVAVDSTTGLVYVTNYINGTVVTWSGNTVVSSVTVGQYARQLVLDSATGTRYVSTNNPGFLYRISSSGVVTNVSDSGRGEAFGLVRDTQTNTLYTTRDAANLLTVVSAASSTILSAIPTGAAPYGAAVDSTTHTVYTANNGGNTVSIFVAPVIASGAPPSFTVNSPYSFTVVASGTLAPTFSVTSGSLPAGLVLNATTGIISGTPSNVASATFTVAASNGIVGVPATSTATYTIAGGVAPTFTSQAAPTTGQVNVGYAYPYAATGSPVPTFSVSSGALPTGLTLTTAGVLSGTPTTAGTFTFQVAATNGVNPVAVSTARTVTIAPAGLLTASISSLQLAIVSAATLGTNQTVTGQMLLTVADTTNTGKGWNVSVSSGPVAYSGTAGGGSIPASNFAITSVGAVTLLTGQALVTGTDAVPTGPQSAAITSGVTGTLDIPRKVIRAGAGYGTGSYTIPIFVSLIIPANRPVGLYSAPLTVNMFSAP